MGWEDWAKSFLKSLLAESVSSSCQELPTKKKQKSAWSEFLQASIRRWKHPKPRAEWRGPKDGVGKARQNKRISFLKWLFCISGCGQGIEGLKYGRKHLVDPGRWILLFLFTRMKVFFFLSLLKIFKKGVLCHQIYTCSL